ncbi:hypothetical protein K466DRAFT_580826 [Polyporus arcularius HHB13444]|uniref:Secreted protein n=1 Tax=Polyporus arcularius HHB13444 TaxID=1314778 RepID=A0A5C3PUL4_9APHY|nr:hypothetical protein K466DRAFT_580826 [Polyporus arcularius HHB13444]
MTWTNAMARLTCWKGSFDCMSLNFWMLSMIHYAEAQQTRSTDVKAGKFYNCTHLSKNEQRGSSSTVRLVHHGVG